MVFPWIVDGVPKRREDLGHDALEDVNAHGVPKKGMSRCEFGWPFKFVIAESLDSGAFVNRHAAAPRSDPCAGLFSVCECRGDAPRCGFFYDFTSEVFGDGPISCEVEFSSSFVCNIDNVARFFAVRSRRGFAMVLINVQKESLDRAWFEFLGPFPWVG